MSPITKVSTVIVCIGAALGIYHLATPKRVPIAVAPPAIAVSTPASPPATAHPSPANLLPVSTSFYTINGAMSKKEDLPLEAAGSADAPGAFRVSTTKTTRQIYDVGLTYPLVDVAFKKGKLVTARFKARSPSAAMIVIQMQSNIAPEYKPCWTKFLTLSPEWAACEYTFAADRYEPNQGVFSIKFG